MRRQLPHPPRVETGGSSSAGDDDHSRDNRHAKSSQAHPFQVRQRCPTRKKIVTTSRPGSFHRRPAPAGVWSSSTLRSPTGRFRHKRPRQSQPSSTIGIGGAIRAVSTAARRPRPAKWAGLGWSLSGVGAGDDGWWSRRGRHWGARAAWHDAAEKAM